MCRSGSRQRRYGLGSGSRKIRIQCQRDVKKNILKTRISDTLEEGGWEREEGGCLAILYVPGACKIQPDLLNPDFLLFYLHLPKDPYFLAATSETVMFCLVLYCTVGCILYCVALY